MALGERAKKIEEERMAASEVSGRLDELLDRSNILDAVEVILNIHYVLGDMDAQEALDEICHIVFPESCPRSSNQKVKNNVG